MSIRTFALIWLVDVPAAVWLRLYMVLMRCLRPNRAASSLIASCELLAQARTYKSCDVVASTSREVMFAEA